jgi:hypothetical protein
MKNLKDYMGCVKYSFQLPHAIYLQSSFINRAKVINLTFGLENNDMILLRNYNEIITSIRWRRL